MGLTRAAVLKAIKNDPGPFEVIAEYFDDGTRRWAGVVVVSPVAIYLRKDGHGHEVGKIGALQKLGDVLTGNTEEIGRATCLVMQLPAHLRSLLDPRGLYQDRGILIAPRSATRFIKTSRINNKIEVETLEGKFSIEPHLLLLWKVHRKLESLGWKLNEATPTGFVDEEGKKVEEPDSPPILDGFDLSTFLAIGFVMFVILVFVVLEYMARTHQ